MPVTFGLFQPTIGEYDFAGIGRYTGDDIVLTGSVGAPAMPPRPQASRPRRFRQPIT